MIKYTDYDFYINIYKGNMPEDDFNKLVIRASNYINKQTSGRIDKNNIPEQVKYVTCLIVNLINEQETKLSEIGNLKSQNIEGWSESYATPEEIEKEYSEKMQTTLSTYLWDVIGIDGNPLLYCGVC